MKSNKDKVQVISLVGHHARLTDWLVYGIKGKNQLNLFSVFFRHHGLIKEDTHSKEYIMMVNVTTSYSFTIFEISKHEDVNHISKLQVQNKGMYFMCLKIEYTLYHQREEVYQWKPDNKVFKFKIY